MQIKVTKSIHIEQSDFLEDAWVRSLSYAALDRDVLIESVLIGQQREFYYYHNHIEDPRPVLPYGLTRRSEDNGRTWTVVERRPHFRPLRGRVRLEMWGPSFILHPRRGWLARVYASNEDVPGLKAWDKGSPVQHSGRIWVQYSVDAGLTWTEPEQLIVCGAEYDADHWAPGVWVGRATGFVEAVVPVYVDDDTFVLPMNKAAYEPGRDGLAGYQSGLLLGRWMSPTSIEWNGGRYVYIDRPYSIFGADEPCLARLPDGRLLMSLRVQATGQASDPPGRRYFATSSDMGKTWSTPDFFRYDDGGDVYNPGCLGHILRAAKNGRMYLITHLLDRPSPNGQLPRDFLHVVEFDADTLRVRRDTVTVIEGFAQPPEKWDDCWYSNWVWYEDRQTKNLVLFMTGNPGDQGRHDRCNVPPHSFRYELDPPGV